jgi:hypothetical protein
MAERRETYWSKNHWAIFQCSFAAYCSVLATLEFRRTRLPPATQTASVGAPVTAGYPMPWYLWAGIVCLCLSVMIPAVIGMIRKRRMPPVALAEQSKLKIISAYYGVKGGPDEDVAEKYLRPRISGGALAGWVGADLFGALDPAIGKYKRLKVRYSYEGREATIERGENELLVLPEDPHLKQATQTPSVTDDAEADRLRREEIQRKADLWNAQESRRLCDEERRAALNQLEEAKSQLAIFTPLQVDLLALAKELRSWHKGIPEYPMLNKDLADGTSEGRTRALTDMSARRSAWATPLEYQYTASFTPKITKIVLDLGGQGVDVKSLEKYSLWDGNYECATRASEELWMLAYRMDKL